MTLFWSCNPSITSIIDLWCILLATHWYVWTSTLSCCYFRKTLICDCDDHGPLNFSITDISDRWSHVSLSFSVISLRKLWLWLASPWTFPLCFLDFKGYVQFSLTLDPWVHCWTSTYCWKSCSEYYWVERVRFSFKRFCGLKNGLKNSLLFGT